VACGFEGTLFFLSILIFAPRRYSGGKLADWVCDV